MKKVSVILIALSMIFILAASGSGSTVNFPTREITLLINFLNDANRYDSYARAKHHINHVIRKPPSLCVECGNCDEVCPQHLKVMDIMKDIRDNYEDINLQWWRELV